MGAIGGEGDGAKRSFQGPRDLDARDRESPSDADTSPETPATLIIARAEEALGRESQRESQPDSLVRASGIEGGPERVGPYRVHRVLGRGGMGIVYEAVHVTSGARVALKLAVRDSERSLARLRAEVSALQRVSHPGIVRLLDHGSDEGVHFYAMALLEGHTWLEYIDLIWHPRSRKLAIARPPAANGRLAGVLRQARQLAEALDYLHGLGWVHCDVSPRNVLACADGTTVLMDLGLVSRHRGAVGPDVLEPVDTPAGTVGYMAPEQMLGLSVDARADLYSLGAMIHATVTGRPPTRGAPALLSTLVTDVPDELESLVARLLSSNRNERPLTASDVVRVLRSLEGLAVTSLPAAGTRLFRSPIFGRDDLLRLLSRAVARGETRGSFTVVAGESGIGKTALAGSVARVAAMNRFRVVTGECVALVPTGGHHRPGLRGPHFSPLRGLLDVAVDLTLSREEPALAALLGSLAAYAPRATAAAAGDPAPSQPQLTGEGAKSRLCEDLSSLLAELARATPVLVVLDDLHCADELTMAFLTSLPVDYFERNRVVIVATYRAEQSDELIGLLCARPYVEAIALDALSERAVGDMIAESWGSRVSEPWVRVLHAKSGGNPFLVAEYLRTAVDEGALSRDMDPAAASVAAESFARVAGSIEELIERRLTRLSPGAMQLIQLAAVIGNPIPVGLLAETSGSSPDDVREQVAGLIRRNLLEGVDSEHCRFMHDKLREAAYASLDAATRRTLHRRVGRAIEARTESAAAGASVASVLAHHFVRGEDAEKAVAYLELAADVAHRSFANREVVALLTEALSVSRSASDEDRALLAHFHYRLGNAYFGLGRLEESRKHLVQMLDLLDLRAPAAGIGGWLRCVREAAAQVVHRLGRMAHAPLRRRSLLLEAVAAYDLLMQIYFYRADNVPGMIHCTLAGLNLAETLGPSAELRLAYANMQATGAVLGLRTVVRMYETLGSTVESPGDDLGLRTSADVRRCVRHIVSAEWAAAEACVDRIIGEARAVDYQRREEEGISLLAYTRFAQGRYAECRELYRGLHRSAARGDAQSLCWSSIFRAHAHLVDDEAEAAVAVASEGLELVDLLPGRSETINLHATLALGFSRLGDPGRAEHHARTALALGRSAELIVFLEIIPYAYVVEVSQRLALDVPDRAASTRALEAEAFRQLARCGRLFPIAGPRVALWRGSRDWQAGRRSRARASWEKCVASARTLGTPHELAHAELLLGLYGATPQKRDDVLAKAEAAFRALGALHDERRVSIARRPESASSWPFANWSLWTSGDPRR